MPPGPVALLPCGRLVAWLHRLSRHRLPLRPSWRRSGLPGCRGLLRHPALARHGMSATLASASVRVRANADALTDPDRCGPQHTPQLTGFRQVKPLIGPEGEVLVIAGKYAGCVTSAVVVPTGWPVAWTRVWPGHGSAAWQRKPV